MKVPIYKQNSKLSCGPACLRMVLAFYGYEAKEREILNSIGGLKKFGVRLARLAEYGRNHGFKVACYSYNAALALDWATLKPPSPRDVLRFVEKGVPVILGVHSEALYETPQPSAGHFIVVTGYSKGRFSFNDPKDGKRHTIGRDRLLFAWYNNVLKSSAYLVAIWE